MFTGLVEEIGTVSEIVNAPYSIKIKICANKVLKNAKIGDSIATNGVCLTAIELDNDHFVADCMHETINRSNLVNLKVGDIVNLEKSVTLNSFMGGHIVLGDVDTTAEIIDVKEDGIAKIYCIFIEDKYLKYVVEKGRIAIDGASLTITKIENNFLYVSIIPHTIKNITLGDKKVNDKVNIEVDIMAKYIENILNIKGMNNNEITEKFLLENGF